MTPKRIVHTTRTIATQNHCTRLRSSNHHCRIVRGFESSKNCFRMISLSCQNLKWSICRYSNLSWPQSIAIGSSWWSFNFTCCFANHRLVSRSCIGRRSSKVLNVSSMKPSGKKLLLQVSSPWNSRQLNHPAYEFR